jgi:hypothetical protein
MENHIKHITDITYQAELIPAALLRKAKQRGLIRTYNLRLLLFRKLCAH